MNWFKLSFITYILIIPTIFYNNSFFNEFTSLFAKIGFYVIIVLLFGKSLFLLRRKYLILNKLTFLTKFINKNQRNIGILSFNFIIIHVVYQLKSQIYMFNLDSLVSGIIPFLILFYMYITSLKKIQLQFKKFKKTHSIIWLVISLIAIHIYIVKSEFVFLLFISILIPLFIILENYKNDIKKFNHLYYYIIAVFTFILFTCIL